MSRYWKIDPEGVLTVHPGFRKNKGKPAGPNTDNDFDMDDDEEDEPGDETPSGDEE